VKRSHSPRKDKAGFRVAIVLIVLLRRA